jgi:predicted patatin/cPLA2 family phospholipase
LKEFFEFTKINIYFHTTELISMKLEIISHENYPDLPLVKALHMSCAIPMAFSPCFYNEKCFIDGGLLNNYPLSTYFEKSNNSNNVIGFVSKSKRSFKNNKIKKIDANNNILDILNLYIGHFIKKLHTKKKFNIKNEILINTNGINEKDFIAAITCKESRKKYLDDGYQIAENFLKEVNFKNNNNDINNDISNNNNDISNNNNDISNNNNDISNNLLNTIIN